MPWQSLVDVVGNETVYYPKIVLSGDGTNGDCAIEGTGGVQTFPPNCVNWYIDTSDVIGTPCVFI